MERFWHTAKLAPERLTRCLAIRRHRKQRGSSQTHLPISSDTSQKPKKTKSEPNHFQLKLPAYMRDWLILWRFVYFRFLVRVSYMEIYNEEVRDLLAKEMKKSLEVKERADIGVYVKDLSGYVVNNADDLDNIMKLGNKNRATGATKMNVESSRSHAIFSITVESSETDDKGEHVKMGKLQLVDLAVSKSANVANYHHAIRVDKAWKLMIFVAISGVGTPEQNTSDRYSLEGSN